MSLSLRVHPALISLLYDAESTIQGTSVADVFLKKSGWKVKGLTRNPSSPASQALSAKGIQLVQGDVNDVDSLKAAFKGADVIFGNTAFSDAMSNPNSPDLVFLKPGQSTRVLGYELELQQGKNVADAAASVAALDTLIWSSLPDATKWSEGKYTGVYHFDSKTHVVDYIDEKYPELAKKTSTLTMGLFMTNWKWGRPSVPWEKVSYAMKTLLSEILISSLVTRWIHALEDPWQW
jgi:hypothetical protein